MRERVKHLFPNWTPGTKDKTNQVTQAATDYRSEMDHRVYRRGKSGAMRQVKNG